MRHANHNPRLQYIHIPNHVSSYGGPGFMPSKVLSRSVDDDVH